MKKLCKYNLKVIIILVSCLSFGFGQPIIDIHVTVITKNTKAKHLVTYKFMENKIKKLNYNFVDIDRKEFVQFRLKSFSAYSKIKYSSCEFVKLGDTQIKYSSNGWAEIFNNCRDNKVRDPHAVNLYIYDSYSSKNGFLDQTGHGKRNSNRPYILIDWMRLKNNYQSPIEHEMGHALGLSHECMPGAMSYSHTNIMTSSECGKGSGGLRDIGFNNKQVKRILTYVKKIQKRLK